MLYVVSPPWVFLSLASVVGVWPGPLHLSSIIESCYKLNRTTTTNPERMVREGDNGGNHETLETEGASVHHTDTHAGIRRGLYSIKYSLVFEH